jgi:gamma-glutamylcyclotransferase (GGCT)/AIG2-like uncharacterized protein YtfP
MENKDKALIAVYGTLRKQHGNHDHFLRNAEYMGTFKSEPVYTMYSLGGYPGLKENGTTSIVLEVYAVTAAEAAKVDGLEGYHSDRTPTFYDKKSISTPWGEAGIYIFVNNCSGYRVIESGDWTNKTFALV